MDEKASVSELIELEEAAERAAARIKQVGWPEHQFFPPFVKKRRFGTAFDAGGRLLEHQVFIWVKGSGPWLGEDGALYWMLGSSGTEFYRRSLGELEVVYTCKRVRKVIEHLNVLKY